VQIKIFPANLITATGEVLTDNLGDNLQNFSKAGQIDDVEFVGEITNLPEDKLNEIITLVRTYYTGPLRVSTNLIHRIAFLHRSDIQVNVRFDIFYPHNTLIINNIRTLIKPVRVIVPLTMAMIDHQSPEAFVEFWNDIPNVKNIDIEDDYRSIRHTAWIDATMRLKRNFQLKSI